MKRIEDRNKLILRSVWRAMKARCFNPNAISFKNYGGRGIKVCKEWLNFENFYNDMKDNYVAGLSIDRINNNKDYSKGNCKWSTRKEQAENRRTTHLFTFKGTSDTLTNWAKSLGVNRSLLAQRFYVYNWNVEKTLTEGITIG